MAIYDLREDPSSLLSGINSRLFVREEDVYGEPYVNGLIFEDYYLGLIPGSVITKEQSLIEIDSFTGEKSYFPHQFGKKTTGGVYGFHLNCQTLDKLFLHALGEQNSKVLDFSVDRKEFLDYGLGFLQVVDSSTEDQGYVSYFSGNRISSLTIVCAGNETLINVLFTFVGNDAQFFNKSEVITPNDATKIVENVFPSWNSQLSLTKIPNGDSFILAFKDLEITIENNPIIPDYFDGGDTIREIQLGRRRVSGRFTLPLSSKNSTQNTIRFINDYFNKSNFLMHFTCYHEGYEKGSTDPLTGDVVHITLPNVVFSADTTPKNMDYGILGFDVEFIAYPLQQGESEIEYDLIPYTGV